MSLNMKRLVWFLSAFVIVLFGMFTSGQAQASVVPSSAVDSITSSRSTFDPRANGDVTVNFSEKAGHEFQPGDVLELTLPLELHGYNKHFMLEDYADVTVTEGQVRVVFTDKVAKKNNIHGSLWFGVHATETVTKGTTKDVVLDLGTQCKNVPTVKVKGYDAVGGPGDQKYAYKGGWVNKQDPTLIDWYIVINPQRLYMSSDVFIRDILGPGHEYVSGSVLVNQKPVTEKEGLLSMGADNFALQLRRDFVNLNTVEVRYQTKVVEAGKKQAELKNDFTANFQVLYRQPEYLSGSFKVKNVMFDGDIEGDDDLNHATEGVLPDVEGTVEELPSVDTDKTTESVIPDSTEKVTETDRPEILVPTVEEEVTEEEVIETLPVETDKVEGKVEKEVDTDPVTEVKPEQGVVPTEEEVEEGVIVPIPDENIEHGFVEEEEDVTHRATEEKKVEMHVPTVEEKTIEEGIVETEEVEVEKIDGTVEENKATERVTETKPEQHVNVVEDKTTEEVVVPMSEQRAQRVMPEAPSKPEVKEVTVKTVQPTKQGSDEAKELPNTGSENNPTVAIAGMLMLMGAAGARRRFMK